MRSQVNVFFLFLALLFSLESGAENKLVRFSDLVFSNEAEKTAFTAYEQSKDPKLAFDLLFSSYDRTRKLEKSSARIRVSDCISHLKKETADKSDVKKVKFVYDYVHKQFLKVYKLKNSFVDLFDNGEYNCVSASALYALVFTELSIPYEIRETPEHVYLIAYPQTIKMVIETTSPQKGYYQFSTSLINNFAQNLYKTKQITKEEYESASAQDLFNKYYFSSESVNIVELAGFQYSNFAIFDFEDSDLKHAADEIKKACYLFGGKKHTYMLRAILGSLLDQDGYPDTVNVRNLAVLCRFNNEGMKEVSNDDILREFGNITETQLIKSSNYEMFERSYQLLEGAVKDTALLNEISYYYHYELARLGYLNSKGLDYQLDHLAGAYRINPLNANLRTLVLAVFERTLDKADNSRRILEESDRFSQRFDFLETNNSFMSVKANCVLDQAYQSYYFSDVKKGDAYISDFEAMAKKNPEIAPTAAFVEKAYSQAAVEYYKKGNYGRSKSLLKSGLIYAPDSFGLQQRLNQIK